LPQNLSVTLPGDLKIPVGGLLRLLLECVQDVYSFCELRHLKDSMLYGRREVLYNFLYMDVRGPRHQHLMPTGRPS